MIARCAVSDIGKPERQRRAEITADLILPTISQHGREIARGACIEEKWHAQPKRGLKQYHDPDHQPRPGPDQLDNKRGETHEMSGKSDPTRQAPCSIPPAERI